MKIQWGQHGPLLVPVADAHELWHALKAHLKGTLYQEPRISSEDLYLRERTFPDKRLNI